MPNQIHKKISGFSIEFRKQTKHISESDKITIDEQFEVGEKSLFYVESLAHFMTTEASNFDDTDNDSVSIHRINLFDVVDAFLDCALESLGELDKRRIELEEIVAQIPNRR